MDVKNIKIVIGANYGSEGKGMVTDYLCSKNISKTLVILTNGGGQRGHTVETVHEDIGVFHSLGSGSIRGCDTYISKYYILNPILLIKEIYAFQSDFPNIKFKVYLHRDIQWSTAYDMLLNQMIIGKEGKHNSTGFGIYETQKRYKDFRDRSYLSYTIQEFYNLSDTDKVIHLNFLFGYMVERMQEYGISLHDKNIDPYIWDTLTSNQELKDSIIQAIKELVEHNFIEFVDDSILDNYENLVFENGQGLLLDKDYDKDYGTSSKTGLMIPYNMIESRFENQEVEVFYVSRSYLTRHGDGYLPNEIHSLEELKENNIFPDFDYEINEENDYQGYLRYAPLDLEKLVYRCLSDCELPEAFGSLTKNIYTPSIVITHMNECEIDENYMKILAYTEDIRFYRSYGRTSEHIRECKFWEE